MAQGVRLKAKKITTEGHGKSRKKKIIKSNFLFPPQAV
jgi:hypothetical protein